jgi:hypothetical protein
MASRYFCPNCGAVPLPRTRFCTSCGARVECRPPHVALMEVLDATQSLGGSCALLVEGSVHAPSHGTCQPSASRRVASASKCDFPSTNSLITRLRTSSSVGNPSGATESPSCRYAYDYLTLRPAGSEVRQVMANATQCRWGEEGRWAGVKVGARCRSRSGGAAVAWESWPRSGAPRSAAFSSWRPVC